MERPQLVTGILSRLIPLAGGQDSWLTNPYSRIYTGVRTMVLRRKMDSAWPYQIPVRVTTFQVEGTREGPVVPLSFSYTRVRDHPYIT